MSLKQSSSQPKFQSNVENGLWSERTTSQFSSACENGTELQPLNTSTSQRAQVHLNTQQNPSRNWKYYVRRYCEIVVPPRNPVSRDEVDGFYRDEMSFWPPPIAMIFFTFVEIMTYYADYLIDPDKRFGPVAQVLMYNPRKRYEFWRFVSYMFVHADLHHLIGNLVIQFIWGFPLELFHHWWRVSIVYLAGVVAGSMASSVISPGISVVGASAGIYALMTAHVASIILNWNEMKSSIVAITAIMFTVSYCSYDVGLNIYGYYAYKGNGISYIGHIFGALAGLLVGIAVLRDIQVSRTERILRWITLIVYLLLMFTGIYMHIFLPEYFPEQEYN